MPEKEPIKVYVQVDDQGRITAIGSSIFVLDPTGWVQIDEGEGDRYAHAQSHYLGTLTEGNVYKYKLVDSKVVERSAEEIAADIAAQPVPEPTPSVAEVAQRVDTVEVKVDDISAAIERGLSV